MLNVRTENGNQYYMIPAGSVIIDYIMDEDDNIVGTKQLTISEDTCILIAQNTFKVVD